MPNLINLEIKICKCRDCEEEKEFIYENFNVSKGRLIDLCRICSKIRQRKAYHQNIDESKRKAKKYREQNKEKKKGWDKKSQEKRKEKIREYQKKYYKKNKEDKFLAPTRTDEYKQKRNARLKQRRKEDLNFHIEQKLRCRLQDAIKRQGGFKKGKSKELIGCSYEFLISYLESKFTKLMSWDYYKNGEIHIDHILPCSSFDLTIKEEQKKCFHYSNLQPLWKDTETAIKYGESGDYIGNMNKSDRILQHE